MQWISRLIGPHILLRGALYPIDIIWRQGWDSFRRAWQVRIVARVGNEHLPDWVYVWLLLWLLMWIILQVLLTNLHRWGHFLNNSTHCKRFLWLFASEGAICSWHQDLIALVYDDVFENSLNRWLLCFFDAVLIDFDKYRLGWPDFLYWSLTKNSIVA